MTTSSKSASPLARRPQQAGAEPKSVSTGSGTSRSASWTFLTNHAHVLLLLSADPELRMRDIATRVGITERAVQRIVDELSAAGYVQVERVGRRNRYQVVSTIHLRHPIESERTIGDLIRMVYGER